MAALEKLKIDDPSSYDSCTVAMGLSLGEVPQYCILAYAYKNIHN